MIFELTIMLTISFMCVVHWSVQWLAVIGDKATLNVWATMLLFPTDSQNTVLKSPDFLSFSEYVYVNELSLQV